MNSEVFWTAFEDELDKIANGSIRTTTMKPSPGEKLKDPLIAFRSSPEAAAARERRKKGPLEGQGRLLIAKYLRDRQPPQIQ